MTRVPTRGSGGALPGEAACDLVQIEPVRRRQHRRRCCGLCFTRILRTVKRPSDKLFIIQVHSNLTKTPQQVVWRQKAKEPRHYTLCHRDSTVCKTASPTSFAFRLLRAGTERMCRCSGKLRSSGGMEI